MPFKAHHQLSLILAPVGMTKNGGFGTNGDLCK
jgi:hypothetical protein